ncbi:hypothetical protein ACU6VI_09325 [Sphaerotilus natans]|uniref:hypothetical protein n=1 Tax=Sphaerotilus natans TaxID=34103 RepID=UPI00406D4972
MFDDLGVVSVLIQLLLILVLLALYSWRRHLRSRQQRYRDPAAPRRRRTGDGAPASAARPEAVAVEAPRRAERTAGLRSDDLLPPSFADTCADWTPLAPQPVERARGCVADPASAPIDLDAPLRCIALEQPFDEADRSLARGRPVLSCTIGRQVHMHA